MHTVQNMNYSFIPYPPHPHSWQGLSDSVCFPCLGAPGCVGMQAPHSMAWGGWAVRPASLFSCPFLLSLCVAAKLLPNENSLLRSRSKNVSLSLLALSKLQLCPSKPFPWTSKCSSRCWMVGIPRNTILEEWALFKCLPVYYLAKIWYSS